VPRPQGLGEAYWHAGLANVSEPREFFELPICAFLAVFFAGHDGVNESPNGGVLSTLLNLKVPKTAEFCAKRVGVARLTAFDFDMPYTAKAERRRSPYSFYR
jgi:hypothetical protein